MTRVMPPLNPLHVFEAAARLGNFTRAAEELHVTQSAVSRQIGTLEAYLGVRLFERDRSGVSLTATGRSFFTEVSPAFAALSNAAGKVISSVRGQQVRVRTYTTFVAKWLMRRLGAFQAEHPLVEVKISTATQPVDFLRDEIDLAIQVGTGPWPGAVADRLFADEIAPVCAPSLTRGPLAVRSVDDLHHHRLLHAHYRRSDWAHWLAHVGRPELNSGRNGMTFSSSVLTYQAAVEGIGVAMGQLHLLQAEIESGALVCPLAPAFARDAAYHVLIPAGRSLGSGAYAFRSWLMREAGGSARVREAGAATRVGEAGAATRGTPSGVLALT